ncbi:MAG: hypothetical protein V3W32_01100, partial [Gemmatimonadota bacterium]
MKNLAPRFPSRRRRLYPHPALLLAAALAAASCSTAPPRQTAFMSGTENVDLTSMEVRIHAYGYAERFSARVENAADEILAVTEDADVARNALLWKMNALPAMHLAVFQPDPLIGFLDAWTLTVQMGDFFTTGAGRDAFGPLQSIAVEASEALERAVGEVIASVTVSGDAPWAERTVRAWADSHPITSMEFLRETTASEFADVLGQDQAGGMAVLGSLAMQATDLSERLKYYAAAMPKQIRWQSELVVLELLDQPDVEEFLGNVESIDRSALRLADFGDTVPALVGDQAAFAIDALSAELLAGADRSNGAARQRADRDDGTGGRACRQHDSENPRRAERRGRPRVRASARAPGVDIRRGPGFRVPASSDVAAPLGNLSRCGACHLGARITASVGR